MGPPGADERDRGMSNASSARRGRYRQAARDAAFLLRLWPILLLAFLVVVLLIALGAGTAVLGVGVPVLVLGLSVSSRFAEIGRRAVADVDSSEYVPGHYRRPGAGAPRPTPAWSGTSTTGPSSASCAWAWAWPGPSGRPPGTRGPRRRSSTGPSPRPARPRRAAQPLARQRPAGAGRPGAGRGAGGGRGARRAGPGSRRRGPGHAARAAQRPHRDPHAPRAGPSAASCEQGPTVRVGAPGRRLAILPRRPATAASRSAKRGGLPERPMGADCKSAA